MVYKVDKRLVTLTVLLFISSLFFTLSVYIKGMGGGALVVCFVAVAFIVFNLLVLFSKKIEIEDGVISQTTIYGKKSVNVAEIEDIGVVKLRWRIILILSDPQKFVFISSLYENFEEFVEYLRGLVCNDVTCLLDPVTPKSIAKKRRFLNTMIIAVSVFFVGSGVYNILYS